MRMIIDFLKSDVGIVLMPLFIILVLILYFVNNAKLNKIQKNYQQFLDKLGDGKNIKEDLNQYLDSVKYVNNQNKELQEKYNLMRKGMQECIQKVGIVRYTAYTNIGSDLSFALALLDENNSGVVLNGIYSTDMSNIYAKPVEKGKSTYKLSEQEKEAIEKAINNIK